MTLMTLAHTPDVYTVVILKYSVDITKIYRRSQTRFAMVVVQKLNFDLQSIGTITHLLVNSSVSH